ncbi:MAG: hypothetical protein GEU93_09545 [Propionibacteriales bacterium]|nr:hypothetical protein [Propionibacteriales bacterium]
MMFCDHCGERLDSGVHTECEKRRTLEPPRYCPQCRRRMKVQVTPRGWTATCSRHGETDSPS